MIRILFSFLVSLVLFAACNQKAPFKSDVETDKKPWTHLNFYNDPDNFQFVIVSDRTGGNRKGIFEDAIGKVNQMMPEFVMCVGDLIQGYTRDTAQIRKEWDEVNAEISQLKMPFFYLPGNHDITNEVMQEEWEKRYGRRYYNFVYKNTLFIALDSNDDDDHNLTHEQTDFVLKSLKDNPDVRWTFIFMHHPIWTYDTDGRFEEIEKVLENRKYTVIAGHTHHYHHEERNNANYYTMATTGGGSGIRGQHFGEFDHITWMTVTENGPVMANLKLDGILAHDVSNAKTRALGNSMLDNTGMQHLVLCNKGAKFRNGTLYLSFQNKAEEELQIDLNFYHHHQLRLKESEYRVHISAGENKTIEIPFDVSGAMDYAKIGLLRFDWKMEYVESEFKDFKIEGKYQIFVEPSETDYMDPDVTVFLDKTQLDYPVPFDGLDADFSMDGRTFVPFTHSFPIEKSGDYSFVIKNKRNQTTKVETRTFTKTSLHDAVEVSNLIPGLKYKYVEGKWNNLPDFDGEELKASGHVDHFEVRDIAMREDYWALEYKGYIKIPEDNIYQFRTRADDASSFEINGTTIVDENSMINGEFVGAVALKKGFHPVTIKFLEKQGNQRLRFYVKNRMEEDWTFMYCEKWFFSEK